MDSAANLRALTGPALLYGVPWNTVDVASEGYLTSDHGQASHILAKTGVIGFALWVLALVILLRKTRYSLPQAVAIAVLAGGAARMMTESTFELEVRHVGFVALLAVIGLMSNRAAAGLSVAQRVPRRREMLALGSALAAAAVAATVVPLLMPSAYTARTVLAVTVPTGDSTSAEESFRARSHAAASVEAVGARPSLLSTAAADAHLTPEEVDGMTVGVSRAPEAHYLRLTTTGPDPANAAALGDAAAARIARELSSQGGAQGSAVEVRPMGTATVDEVAPWRAHLTALCLSAAAAAAAAWAAVRGRDRRRTPWRHRRPQAA